MGKIKKAEPDLKWLTQRVTRLISVTSWGLILKNYLSEPPADFRFQQSLSTEKQSSKRHGEVIQMCYAALPPIVTNAKQMFLTFQRELVHCTRSYLLLCPYLCMNVRQTCATTPWIRKECLVCQKLYFFYCIGFLNNFVH